MKGFTAYEFSFFCWDVRICHLKGPYWAWKPWRRISITKVS